MKKISIYLLALTIIAAGLTACSSNNAAPSPSPVVSATPDVDILPDTDDGIIDNDNADDGMIDDNGTNSDDIITDSVSPSQSPTGGTGGTNNNAAGTTDNARAPK